MNNLKEKLNKGYKKTTLKNVCFLEYGKKVKSGLRNYLEIGDINIEDKSYDISRKEKRTVNGSIKVPKGTLLISRVRPTRGAITITKDEINVSNAFCKIKLENKYLYYILSREKFFEYLGSCSTGSTYHTCKDQDILNYKFLYIKNTKIQKQIAEILSKVDEDIEATEAVIKKTEKLKKGLMQKLLTKGIGHKKFKKTKWGIIPEEWEVKKIKDAEIDLVDGDRGVNYPKKNEFFEKEYCLFLSNKNIKNDKFVFEEKVFITKEKDEKLRKGRLNRGDIVLTTRGTIGTVGFYDDSIEFENIRINSGMLILRANRNFGQKFLYKLLASPFMKKKYKDIGTGSAQPQLPINVLKNIFIPIPSIKEQKEIARILSKVDEKIEVYQEIRKKLEKLKKGLMQDLLK